MTTHDNHQFMEVGKGKTEGNLEYKNVMCPDCGEMRKMREDGKIEKIDK